MGDFNRRETWRGVSAAGSDQARVAAAQFPAKVWEVAALEVLRANAKAVELLTGRALVRHQIRPGGWRDVGADRRSTGDHEQAARGLYHRKIEEQEGYLPDLQDAAAAHAVLEDAEED